MLDHSDLQERVRIFGTEACDTSLTDGLQLILQTPLRSWIAAAVTCDDEPIAVMFVANKRFESLPEVFSGTDSELIGSICKILARGLAQAQTNHAIWKISDFTFRHAVHEPTERRDLLKLVQSHVPGIVAGAVSLRLREQDPPDEQWEMGELEPNAMTVLNARMQRPLRIPTSTSLQKLAVVDTGHAPPYYVYEQRLPYVSEGRTAVVHLASRRERLAKFELDVLRYFGADLCQVIRSEQMVRQRNEDFIQIRHALRSGVQGVRHIDNAWEVYEQIAKKGMEPSDLRIAMLRKSLEWTRLFAGKASPIPSVQVCL